MSRVDGCRFCGSLRNGRTDCAPATCLGCGTVQCFGNGGARGTCAVCHYGILPGWSLHPRERVCGYKGCDRPSAFNYVPRVGPCCAEHADRAKVGAIRHELGGFIVRGRRPSITLRQYVAQCLEKIPGWVRGIRDCTCSALVRDLALADEPGGPRRHASGCPVVTGGR